MLTFDDAVDEKNINYYHYLFGREKQSNLYNPNGCPIKSTFFITDVGNNYTLTREIYQQGHEVATHTMTHKYPIKYWKNLNYTEYEKEVKSAAEKLSTLSYIPKNKMKGFRVPFLEVGGDTQYKVLRNLGFAWDSSMLTGSLDYNHDPPVWPFTLNYPPKKKYCSSGTRPNKTYPGFWEVPLIRFYGNDGKPCAMGGMCTQPESVLNISSYLLKNFQRYYNTNKAPFGIFIHSYWFDRNIKNLYALRSFLETLKYLGDTYIVSVSQALEWVKNPTSLMRSKTFKPWQC